jgi:hypothetical protein
MVWKSSKERVPLASAKEHRTVVLQPDLLDALT